ncbi:hypothetical protein GCM10009785_25780 [Brooklawnia cerclae]|uniref:Rho termination factor N-terminal domain-containing protein n=1 Tax=Brooklawnia cerclae TaxID=349934 RepID=A0ABX0SAM4_9ACTN|nr:hypothetical protein [Brooklawnia cerclae]NIH55458.1 hypothetical protein [Brooklawnia cerclae]
MNPAAKQAASRQIRRATEALNALAARDDEGAALAGQLAGLVAVLAETAAEGTRFNADLVAALAPGVEPARTPGARSATTESVATTEESGPSGVAGALRERLGTMTVAELRALIRERGIPHPRLKALSKARKAELIEVVLVAEADEERLPDARSASAADAAIPGTEVVDAAPAGLASAGATPTSVAPSARQGSGRGRRRPSVLDPYALARQEGETGLRARLDALDADQLKDIVRDYGMDYDRRAMRWTDQQRLVGRIVERVDFGTTQGSAFRGGEPHKDA